MRALLAAALLSLALADAAPSPACASAPDPGPCRAFFRRFFWDAATQACEPFIYGGCYGYVPFRTASECEAARCTAHGVALVANGGWESLGERQAVAPRGARTVRFVAETIVM